jgi:hypothetical protein
MRTKREIALLSMAAMLVVACTERTPSGLDDSQIPEPPVTVSLELAWADFGSNLAVYSGYGLVDAMSTTTIAKDYGGVDVRSLFQFDPFPTQTQVRDDSTNAIVTDTTLTFIDAYVVAVFDTIASTNTDTVSLTFAETLEEWDSPTVSWTHAYNQPTAQRLWSQPGGGATLPIRTAQWDRATGDSAQFFLDSAQIARWRTGADSVRAGRLELESSGHRLKLTFAALRLVATSEFNPDTVIVLTVATTDFTYIYNPPAAAPTDGMRVGGSPSWRTVLDVALPTTLSGPPELCAVAGCPYTLEPRNVTYAALTVRSPPWVPR